MPTAHKQDKLSKPPPRRRLGWPTKRTRCIEGASISVRRRFAGWLDHSRLAARHSSYNSSTPYTHKRRIRVGVLFLWFIYPFFHFSSLSLPPHLNPRHGG